MAGIVDKLTAQTDGESVGKSKAQNADRALLSVNSN